MKKVKKEIVINVSIGETRIAIIEEGKLVELFFERPETERMVGDIYLGKVAKVIRGMQAAFIDIGMKQDAFLHFSDIAENSTDLKRFLELTPENPRRRRTGGGNHDPQIKQGQPPFSNR